MRDRTRARWVVMTGLVLLAGCQGAQTADKTSGDTVASTSGSSSGAETVVLHLASLDEINDNGQTYGPRAFIDSLADVSGGLITAQVDEKYGDGSAGAEAELVKAIATGKVDGGWPSTRAFAAAGIPGLEVVEAPMTITSYAAEKDLVSGPVADALLAKLDGTGVVGLGLTVGALRRPFAAQTPLLAPADWHGIKFRTFNSPVQSETITALGAVPVNAGFEWTDEILAGRLRGAEFDVAQYAANGLTTEAGQVTADVVLWPKVPLLSLSRQRFESLTDQQQQWVRDAAKHAVQASVDATYDESTPAQQLCAQGAQFYQAGPDQTQALQAVVQPVLDRLAADPTSGPLLTDIQAIAAKHPPDPPSTCATAATAPHSG
jgi:TRAP-type C4-dicarboxylate transport system substrate-binding protein